jgi:hypothetical protein
LPAWRVESASRAASTANQPNTQEDKLLTGLMVVRMMR